MTGCGFLFRTDVGKRVNFLDAELVFYAEDSDFCYRMREQGFKIIYVPQAKMWHKTSTTLARNRALQLHYITRNLLFVIQRHKIGFHPLTLLIHLLVWCPFKMVVYFLLFRWQNVRGIWNGIRDWRHGKTGWIEKQY